MRLDFSALKEKINFSLPSFDSGRRRKKTAGSNRKVVFYLVYGFFVFALVFAGSYFGSKAEPFIRAELAKQKLYLIDVASIETSFFPPRLLMGSVVIKDRKTKKKLIHLARLDLKPHWASFMQMKGGVDFYARAYGADVNGVVSTGKSFNPAAVRVRAKCEDLQVNNLEAVSSLGLGIRGTGNVSVDFSGKPANLNSFRGNISAVIKNPSFDGVKPLFRVPRVESDNINLELNLKQSVLNVQKLRINGKQLSGELKGKLMLNYKNISNSKMDLKGNVKASPALFNLKAIAQKKAIALMKAKKPISIELSDTFANPWISLAN